MHVSHWCSQSVAVTLLSFSLVCFADETEKVRNEKVSAWEESLKPGEKIAVSTEKPTLLLYLTAGTLDITPRAATRTAIAITPGEVKFEPDGVQEIRNGGSSPVRVLRVEFDGRGSQETWGRTGLSTHYKVLLENEYVRVYDIFIPATSNEPQHTHKDRIVVCLAGAELTHLFPDGRTEVSTLKTGEIVWRKGSTHVGQNHSANDFHAIAIEPK